MDINGASAIVTGGASGIGAAVARQLAAQGAKVVVADLNSEKGEELANEIGGVFAPVDVTKTDQIKAAIEQAEELGPIRALVNSAGIGWAQRTVGRDGSYESAADLDAFSKVVAINLIGTFDCVRLVGTAMSRNEPTEIRRAWRHRQPRERRRLRRADRAGGVLRVQGWCGRHDPAGRP